MGIFMSIQHPDSVGKVRKILRFETGFHDSASDCTKLTLAAIQTCNLTKNFATWFFRDKNVRENPWDLRLLVLILRPELARLPTLTWLWRRAHCQRKPAHSRGPVADPDLSRRREVPSREGSR